MQNANLVTYEWNGKVFTSQERLNTLANEQEINGIRIVMNYQEDRVQLFFQDKAHAMKYRDAGKLSGWNWSHKNQAWQRKLTNNAKHAALNLVKSVL